MGGAEGSNLPPSAFPHIWLNPTSVLPICTDAFCHLPNLTLHSTFQHRNCRGIWDSRVSGIQVFRYHWQLLRIFHHVCDFFEWMLFISHFSSQNIVSWHSSECERGRKTINYFWLTFSICVCVCRGGLLCIFFHRTSGLNWVNWHLAIWSDSPALCGSLYDSKISAVRLSAWAVILLEVLTPLLAGISARCVNGNTKKSIVWCRVGRE